MKHKLVLVFAEDNEVTGIEKCLVFNNALDAEQFLLSTSEITEVKIEPDSRWFSFKTNIWSGHGRSYWAVDNS